MFDQFITINIISDFWHKSTNGTITKNEKIVTNVKSIFQRNCFNSFQLTELVKSVLLHLRNGKYLFNFLQKKPPITYPTRMDCQTPSKNMHNTPAR